MNYKARLPVQTLSAQRGLTLIELTVVLLVLIGLASLLLPYVGGFLGETHNTTSANSGTETMSALSRYEQQFGKLPNNLDLLTDNTTTGQPASTSAALGYVDAKGALNAIALNGLSVSNGAGLAPGLSTFTATTNPGTPSLNAAGLTSVIQNVATVAAGKSATFDVGNGPVTLADTSIVQQPASSQALEKELGYKLKAGHGFVLFGVNGVNDAIGKTIQTAPVHFPDEAAFNPTVHYGRFMAALDVDTNTANTQKAKLVGIVHVTDAIESVNSNLNAHYTDASNQ